MSRTALFALVIAGAILCANPSRAGQNKSANRELPTLILPGAWSVMIMDQQREEAMIRRESRAFMDKVKRNSLFLLRTERDRAVARAIAAAAASQPFPPSAGPSVSLVDRSVEIAPGGAEGYPDEPPPMSPGFVGRAVDRTAQAARDVVSQAADVAASLEKQASAHPSPGGFYALALIALFLVPSMGLASVFWGIVHLRHRSLFPGSAWIVVGAGLLWLAFSSAKTLVLPMPAANGILTPPAAPLSASSISP